MTTHHRVLLTFDVTDWPESRRLRLAAAGEAIGAEAVDFDAPEPGASGWTTATLEQLLGRLSAQGAGVQAATIREALTGIGEVARSRVYEIAGYAPTRSLKGFTRPVNRIVSEMTAAGVIPETADVPLEPIYDPAVRGYQSAKGFRLAPGVLEDCRAQ